MVVPLAMAVVSPDHDPATAVSGPIYWAAVAGLAFWVGLVAYALATGGRP